MTSLRINAGGHDMMALAAVATPHRASISDQNARVARSGSVLLNMDPTETSYTNLILRANREGNSSEFAKLINQKIEQCVKQGSDPKTYSSARKTLIDIIFSLDRSHYPLEREKALKILIKILEKDPLTSLSSNGIVDDLQAFLQGLNKENFQGESLNMQREMAYACTCLIENIICHFNDQNRSSISSNLKALARQRKNELQNLSGTKVFKQDPVLAEMSLLIQEGIKRLVDDKTASSAVMEGLAKIGDALSAAYRVQVGTFLREMGEFFGKIEGSKQDWYEGYFTLRRIVELLLKQNDPEISKQMIQTILEMVNQKEKNSLFSQMKMLFRIVSCTTLDATTRQAALLGDSSTKMKGFDLFISDEVLTLLFKDEGIKVHPFHNLAVNLCIDFIDNSRSPGERVLRMAARKILITIQGSRMIDRELKEILNKYIPADFSAWLTESRVPTRRASLNPIRALPAGSCSAAAAASDKSSPVSSPSGSPATKDSILAGKGSSSPDSSPLYSSSNEPSPSSPSRFLSGQSFTLGAMPQAVSASPANTRTVSKGPAVSSSSAASFLMARRASGPVARPSGPVRARPLDQEVSSSSSAAVARSVVETKAPVSSASAAATPRTSRRAAEPAAAPSTRSKTPAPRPRTAVPSRVVRARPKEF